MISIITAAYNEAESLPTFIEAVSTEMVDHGPYEIIVVNDGSMDRTLDVLKASSATDQRIKYVSLTRNFGQQAALKAGIDVAKGDCAIMLDTDLQHPPELISEMLSAWQSGYKIVLGIRNRSTGGIFKRAFSGLFYRVINLLSRTRIPPGAADFRLLDRQVINFIRSSEEYHIFLRGIVPWTGFRMTSIRFKAAPRLAGKAHYTTSTMLGLSIDGITSFSTRPLRLSTILGLSISVLSFGYILYALYTFFFTDKAVIGWASLLISVLFIGGLQLIFIGIIGEYIGKIYEQVKRRPVYLIDEKSEGLDEVD